MCQSLEVSMFTFVLGMFFSYIIADHYRRVPAMLSICLAWQPMVFMSLFDALVLKEHRDKEGSMFGIYASIFTTILQPSLMGLLLLVREGISSTNRFFASVLIITHVYWCSYLLTEARSIETIPQSDLVYCFVTINLFLLLVAYTDMALLLTGATILNYLSIYCSCEDCAVNLSSVITVFTPCLLAFYWDKYHTAPEVSSFGPKLW